MLENYVTMYSHYNLKKNVYAWGYFVSRTCYQIISDTYWFTFIITPIDRNVIICDNKDGKEFIGFVEYLVD